MIESNPGALVKTLFCHPIYLRIGTEKLETFQKQTRVIELENSTYGEGEKSRDLVWAVNLQKTLIEISTFSTLWIEIYPLDRDSLLPSLLNPGKK